jgi:ParB/RepB/Spo0J family partition protein
MKVHAAKQVKISTLKQNPLQQKFFGPADKDLYDTEIQSLAENMSQNGQKTPIEILPDGTIISGHRRLAAAIRLGWKKIDVFIRDDLADDPDAAEREFLNSNATHRHLTQSQVARMLQRQMELEKSNPTREQGISVRDHIGKLLGKSGRNVDRLLEVLPCPPAILAALDRGDLPLKTVRHISKTDKVFQERIATALTEAPPAHAKRIVKQFLPSPRPRRMKPETVCWHLRKIIQEELDSLEGSENRMHVREDDILAFERLIECAERLILRGDEIKSWEEDDE